MDAAQAGVDPSGPWRYLLSLEIDLCLPASPWGSVSISSSPGASAPLFLILTFLISHGRASLLRHKGLLVVDVLLGFGEHLGHAFLRVLRDGEQ